MGSLLPRLALSSLLLAPLAQAEEPFLDLKIVLDSVKQSQSLQAKAQCFGLSKDQLYSRYERAANNCHKPGQNLAKTEVMLAFIACTEPKLQDYLGVSDQQFERCSG